MILRIELLLGRRDLNIYPKESLYLNIQGIGVYYRDPFSIRFKESDRFSKKSTALDLRDILEIIAFMNRPAA